jgi:outer membrane immunogenic protein
MKRFFGLIFGAALSSASAADFPVKAPMASPVPWTGVYIGGFGSYSVSDFNFPDPAVGLMRAKGWMGGVTLGADYQLGQVVVGALGDVGFGDNGLTSMNGNVMTESVRERLFSTIRGRAGYLFGPVLLFASAGVAFADAEQTETCPSGALFGFCHRAGPYSLSASRLFVSGVYGGGAEWLFAPHWSAKVEYLYSNLGTETFNLGAVPAVGGVPTPIPLPPGQHTVGTPAAAILTSSRDVSLRQQEIKFGINYRF